MEPKFAHGKICYLEVPSTDPARAASFYSRVFGWEIGTRGDGRTTFNDPVGQVGGSWVVGRSPSSRAGVLIYLMVKDAAATLAAIRANGGTIVQEIGMDPPEITARFTDPDGNLFGIYQQPGL